MKKGLFFVVMVTLSVTVFFSTSLTSAADKEQRKVVYNQAGKIVTVMISDDLPYLCEIYYVDGSQNSCNVIQQINKKEDQTIKIGQEIKFPTVYQVIGKDKKTGEIRSISKWLPTREDAVEYVREKEEWGSSLRYTILPK